jgi:hypothetical protein
VKNQRIPVPSARALKYDVNHAFETYGTDDGKWIDSPGHAKGVEEAKKAVTMVAMEMSDENSR